MSIESVLRLLGACLLVIAVYHRLRAARSGERLDRTKEGWPMLIGLRAAGVATMVTTVAWLGRPDRFEWAQVAMPGWARWIGVAGFALSVAWLAWMFVSLGRNITDTVVTRAEATLVESGPYRYVRNPMYVGVLAAGLSLGLALGTWLLPIGYAATFALMAIRTPTEEKYLIAKFGAEYEGYMRRVGRFFPKVY